MRKPKRSYLVLIPLLAASAAFLLYTVTGKTPAGRKAGPSARQTAASSSSRSAPDLKPAVDPDKVDYSRYEMIVQRGLFSPPAPPQTGRPRGAPTTVPPLQPPKPVQPQPASPPSFAGWSYIGYFAIDGKMKGIVQNSGERAVEYLAEGDKFRGATVEQVAPQQIRLKSGASSVTIHLVESFPVVPLDRDAAAGAPASRAPR